MPNRKRIFLMIACFLLALTCLTGCSSVKNSEQIERYTRHLLDALIAEDPDAAYEQMQDSCTREEFEAFYVQIVPRLDGVESYELEQTGWYLEYDNGVNYSTIYYAMTTPDGVSYDLTCVAADGYRGLAGFHIADTTRVSVGVHAVFIVLSVAILAFVVWMILDCVKRKPKKKVLWILLILLSLKLTLTIGGGMMYFYFGAALSFSFWNASAFGGISTVVMYLPVGALIYFFMRKRITPKQEEQPEPYGQMQNDFAVEETPLPPEAEQTDGEGNGE